MSIIFDAGWHIVIPDNPTPQEQSAGKVICDFTEKMTGTRPDLQKESEPITGSAVLISTSAVPFPAAEKYKEADLGEEGVFYAVSEGRVFIGGGSVRGVLYSACTFLEEELHCHVYTEDLTVVPHGTSFPLTEKTVSFIPPMHYRAVPFLDGSEPFFAMFNKMNARADIPDELGSYVEFGIGFVHTLPGLIPDELMDAHPEYFPLIDGVRQKGPGRQRCLTNPDVLQMTIDAVQQDFRAHPNHKIASVSQADTGETGFVCECPACRAVNDAEGSQMGTQLRFVNAVADAVRDEFPDRFIETLAYRFTRHIPHITKPRDNVIIRLCSIECCFSHPIDKCEHGNPAFVKDMREWAEISRHIYIWDYVTNFTHYLAPQPNLPVIGPNMKFFTENSTVGMFPEGAPDARGSELSELKIWLLARLMWDPDFDVEKGTEEFVRAYAKEGADDILDYLTMLNRRAEETGSHRGCYAKPDREFFSPAFISRAKADFSAAKAKVNDSETLRRIRRWEMSIRYIDLVVYPDTMTEEGLRAEYRAFLDDLAPLGITRIREGLPAEQSASFLRDRVREVVPSFNA